MQVRMEGESVGWRAKMEASENGGDLLLVQPRAEPHPDRGDGYRSALHEQDQPVCQQGAKGSTVGMRAGMRFVACAWLPHRRWLWQRARRHHHTPSAVITTSTTTHAPLPTTHHPLSPPPSLPHNPQHKPCDQ